MQRENRVRVRPVTAATEKVCLSESLQSWWDNEVRPGAPDLWFCVFHRATNTTWQLAALISLHLGCAACQHPSCLPSSSTPTSAANPSQSTHGPLSVGSPSVQDHCLGPCMLGFPIVSPSVPLTPIPLYSTLLLQAKSGPLSSWGGRDRAQVCSCAVMTW